MIVGPDGGSSGATAVAEPPPKPPAPAQAPDACRLPVSQQPDRIDLNGGANSATAGLAGALPHLAAGSTYADKNGLFQNVRNGDLPPSVTIEENGYAFQTDAQGRVASAEGNLWTNSADPIRSTAGKANQLAAGGADRLAGDHGGHLIGHRFGGPEELHNLFAQNGNFNTGEFKKLENGWSKAIDAGKSVDVKVQLAYADGGTRPSHVVVSSRVDDGPFKVRAFENEEGGAAVDPADIRGALQDASGASTFARGAEVFGKIATPVAIAADGYSLYNAYREDGDHIGKHTVEQAGSVAGGWAGAAVGAEAGAEGGAAIGAFFGGVGAAPGAIVGGLVGGAVGGIVGSGAGRAAVQLGEDALDAGKKAVRSVASFFGL